MSTMSSGRAAGLRAMMVALLAAALLMVPACADVSQESFDRIEIGMEIRDVQAIMGTDGKRSEQHGIGISAGGAVGRTPSAHLDETYTWESGRQRIIVHTRDGRVTSKHKEGF